MDGRVDAHRGRKDLIDGTRVQPVTCQRLMLKNYRVL